MQLDFNEKVNELEKIFKIKIQNKELLKKALTHSSYTKENEISSLDNYERLEFLGDAILKLCISDYLYKTFPKYDEGQLSKIRSIIVSDVVLADLTLKTGISELIIMGKREEKSGGRSKKSILACAFEAILGAYYLDGKYHELIKYLEKLFKPIIKEVDVNFEKFNAKAVLQEYTQAQNKKTPEYKILEEVGPEHDKIFVVEVSFMDEVLAKGQGKTKKEAEQDAAYNACQKLGVIK